MAVLRHLLGLLAAQDVHDVASAKADAAGLVNAVNAAEHFAGGVGGIPDGGRANAVITVPAEI